MQHTRRALLGSLLGAAGVAAQTTQGISSINIGFKADTAPQRSECGIGALMPWADALWAVTYTVI